LGVSHGLDQVKVQEIGGFAATLTPSPTEP
jgi:hypothetical protein